jgi:competence protein ComEC
MTLPFKLTLPLTLTRLLVRRLFFFLFFETLTLAFLWTLGNFRLWTDDTQLMLLRVSLALGLCLGFGARSGVLRDLPRFGLKPESITGITGTLLDDPRTLGDGRGMGRLGMSQVGARGVRASAEGEILVFYPAGVLPRLTGMGRGSRVFIEGEFGDTGTGGGQDPLFRARSLHVIGAPKPLEGLRTGIRLFLIDRLSAPDWGGLALGLILGVRDNLDTELAASYRNAGCSHVLALSGMHLAILSGIIAFLLKKPLGIRAASIFGALFILVYVYLVGPQPSLGRAALMYILMTIAVLGNFPRSPLSMLCLSFLIQLGMDPRAGDSVSFILSYAALGGILTLGKLVHSLLRGTIPEKLLSPLAASVGAFIATAAITAGFFGLVQPVGIFAGLVIVPLTTVFMILALIHLGLTFTLPVLSPLSAWGLSRLYGLLKVVVKTGGSLPPLTLNSPWPVLALSLCSILVLVLLEGRLSRTRTFCAPFAAP